jgi:hypothetical protein
MKTVLIKSNNGNHSGFNRKWELVSIGDTEALEQEKERYR